MPRAALIALLIWRNRKYKTGHSMVGSLRHPEKWDKDKCSKKNPRRFARAVGEGGRTMQESTLKKGWKNKIGICLCGLLFSAVLTGCSETNENLAQAADQIGALSYADALELLDAAEEAGENERLIARYRGIAYMGLTEYENAVLSFEEALRTSDGLLQPMDIDLSYYLAAACTKNGDSERAVEIYNNILALRSGDEDAYFLRGNALMSLGNFDDAKADFDKVISMDPENYDRLIEIYEVLAYHGYAEAGKEYLRAALDANADSLDHFAIGRIYYYLGEYQKAYLALEDAKATGGVESYLYLGRSYEATGDYNYAASVYQSYLSQYEGNAEIFNQLGLCEMQIGDYESALAAFEAGLALEDTSMQQSLRFNRAVCYEYLGSYETARSLFNEYLAAYPDDAEAQREANFLASR